MTSDPLLETSTVFKLGRKHSKRRTRGSLKDRNDSTASATAGDLSVSDIRDHVNHANVEVSRSHRDEKGRRVINELKQCSGRGRRLKVCRWRR